MKNLLYQLILVLIKIIIFSTVVSAQQVPSQKIDSTTSYFKANQRMKAEVLERMRQSGYTNEFQQLLDFLKQKVISEKNNPQWVHATSILFEESEKLIQLDWTLKRVQEIQKHGIDVYNSSFGDSISSIKKIILLSPLLLEARVIKTTHPDTITSKDFFTTSTILKVIRVFKGDIHDSIIVIRQNHRIFANDARTGVFLERGKQFIFPLYQESYLKGVDRWNNSYPQRASIKPHSNYYANNTDFYLCTHDKALYPLWEKAPEDDEFLTWINYIPQKATQAQIDEIQSLCKTINEIFQKTR